MNLKFLKVASLFSLVVKKQSLLALQSYAITIEEQSGTKFYAEAHWHIFYLSYHKQPPKFLQASELSPGVEHTSYTFDGPHAKFKKSYLP